MPKVEVNDAEFYYEMHGKGDPIVLISGYTCDHSYWKPVLDKLAQTFQVLIFDNRAVGQTKDKGSVLSAEMMADDVIALSDKLGLKKPHIVGQSMGGTIAQKIRIKYGSKIHKLAILSSQVAQSDARRYTNTPCHA